MRNGLIFLATGLFLALRVTTIAQPAAFEIGNSNTNDLPRGKEADGIIGDLVMRNNRVVALISGNLPLRRANMSTFYGADGMTPGCLYDLTFVEKPNDQITIFSPAEQRGPISYVRIVEDGSNGAAVIETVVSAASNDGISKRHEYRMEEGWQGVLITTTLKNGSDAVRTNLITDRWTTFTKTGVFQEVRWADAVNPADKGAYAYMPPEVEGSRNKTNVVLKAGEEIVLLRPLAVGRSPAEAVGIVALATQKPVGEISGRITDESGQGVPSATLEIRSGKERLPAYPDEEGRFAFRFPAGEYDLEISDIGRTAVSRKLNLSENGKEELEIKLGAQARIAFEITDAEGRDIPCKAQFLAREGTAAVNLGPLNRAHGCKDQYHSETGKFSTAIPPGKYRVVVTRGVEYSHLARDIEIKEGEKLSFTGQLKRLVDTSGWVSADYHNHSTPSGDNTCGTDDRIINLAVEHIEFAPTTEHNRLYDWRPHIQKLGLADKMQTVSGLELTGSGPHLNSFPFHPHPHRQDGGAPVWNRDPRISAISLRDHQERNPDRWIQINHPDLVENFIDRDGDGLADGGYVGIGELIDGLEVQNYSASSILAHYPYHMRGTNVIKNREFTWLQLLNRGHRLVGMAVSDAHSVHGNGVGGWRMYMPSKTDEPAKIDWRENSRHAKAGRSILTTGPFLEVTTTEGAMPGSDLRATGGVTLKIKVQCTDWIDIDRVQILVNGRQGKDLNFTREKNPEMFKDGVVKFEREVPVKLSEDAHLIVVAMGEKFDLKTGYGTSGQAALRPCAFNNPIYVDVDGGGFRANGDMLDYSLGGLGITQQEARKKLEEAR